MTYGYIYIIENTINDKKYVGQTRHDIIRRWNSHVAKGSRLKTPIHIDAAIQKHGKDKFCMYVIDTAKTYEELMEKEKYWIKKLDTMNTGYNHNPGGNYRKDCRQSEETRRKNSERMKGKNHFNYGKHLSEETRKKISESVSKFQQRPGYVHPCTGKPRTPEVCRLVSEHWNPIYVICPHCGIKMERRTAKRYHFDNCPNNPKNIIPGQPPKVYKRNNKNRGKVVDLTQKFKELGIKVL